MRLFWTPGAIDQVFALERIGITMFSVSGGGGFDDALPFGPEGGAGATCSNSDAGGCGGFCPGVTDRAILYRPRLTVRTARA
jgi:hypothetical protein